MVEKVLNFEFKKETPNTFVYEEIPPDDEEISVPSIYIRKRFFEDEPRPDKLQLVLKFENK